MRRRGFTLIELLVVIAIIAILIGLLLPAVQKVREAAARSTCSNSLKQVAIGAMNYESAYGTLPPGDTVFGAFGTWQVAILPYIEQQAIFDRYTNFNNTVPAPNNFNYNGGTNGTAATNNTLKILTCPSDPNAGANPFGTNRTTKHNYAANFGNTVRRQVSWDGTAASGGLGCTNPGLPGGTSPCINFLGAPYQVTAPAGAGGTPGGSNVLRQTALLAITDGTSNTLMFAEILQGTAAGTNNDTRGLTWWGPGAGFNTFYPPNTSTADAMQTNGGNCNSVPQQNLPCAFMGLHFSIAARSRHTGGVNASMCDGSVRFFTNNITPVTWALLGASQDGQVVQIP